MCIIFVSKVDKLTSKELIEARRNVGTRAWPDLSIKSNFTDREAPCLINIVTRTRPEFGVNDAPLLSARNYWLQRISPKAGEDTIKLSVLSVMINPLVRANEKSINNVLRISKNM